MEAMTRPVEWLDNEQGIQHFKTPYNVEFGGVFMKDAPVLAGLGCIGKNNILITPEFGPQVRLRVVLLAKDLPSTGILDFDPCDECAEPCRKVCPQKSFAEQVYSQEEFSQIALPGRNGVFNRLRCNVQMIQNEAEAELAPTTKKSQNQMEVVKYCRKCELACPVGN